MSSFRDTSKKKKKKKEKKKKDGKKKKKSSHKNKSLIDEDDDNNSKSNKRKKEIEDALKEFTNPNELVDPDAFDADFQDGTNASANTPNSKYDSSNIDNSEFGPSGRLNLRGGIDMDDDEKYSGKAITRKELVKNNLGQNNEGGDDDEDDEKTRKKIENAYMQRAATIEFDEQNDMISSSSSSDDDDDEYISNNNNKNDNTDQYDDGSSNIANELKRIEAEDKRALMKLSASREDDIVRAKHTKNQMALYDDFLRLRISMQSLVSSANRFPQPDIYPLYKQKILKNKNTNANFDTTLNDVMETMSSLLNIQSTLISRNNNVEKNLKKNNKKRMRKQGNADDGSSSSSSNSSSDDDDDDDSNNVNNEIDRMWKTINETNQDIFNHDREIIDNWDEKIRLQSSASHKALKAVNRTVISQIDALMADKDKIIQRTRTHSVPVKVIGKNDDNNDNSDNILQDDQVYDDNDFYQMQLKEFISSSSINDVERSRLETKVSFKLKKTKRTVDTKASKGRRLKFTPHSKLLNFMAPQPQEECMIDAEGLIGSLFEKTPGGGGGE